MFESQVEVIGEVTTASADYSSYRLVFESKAEVTAEVTTASREYDAIVID